jgi:hypothetical protein
MDTKYRWSDIPGYLQFTKRYKKTADVIGGKREWPPNLTSTRKFSVAIYDFYNIHKKECGNAIVLFGFDAHKQ